MPKSKKRKKSVKGPGGQIAWGGGATKTSGRINLVLGAILAVALVAGGLYVWRGYRTSGAFAALAAQGQAALAGVETTSDRGGGHLTPGQGRVYSERFPTSGRHGRSPVDPGYYRRSQPATKLVHSVEHGHIVIYYESPGAEAIQLLKDWSSLYGGNWDGVIATPPRRARRGRGADRVVQGPSPRRVRAARRRLHRRVPRPRAREPGSLTAPRPRAAPTAIPWRHARRVGYARSKISRRRRGEAAMQKLARSTIVVLVAHFAAQPHQGIESCRPGVLLSRKPRRRL